jgi:hypothetical protein
MSILLWMILVPMAVIAAFGLGWYSVEFNGGMEDWAGAFRDPGNKSYADILETKCPEAPEVRSAPPT